MKEENKELQDDMLFHLSKDIGYKPSSDFTDRIMERVNPAKKEVFLPGYQGLTIQTVLLISLPLLTAAGFGLYAIFSEGINGLSSDSFTQLYSTLFENNTILLSIAIGFSASLYFAGNQLFLSKLKR